MTRRTFAHLLVDSGTLYPTTHGKTGNLVKGTGAAIASRLRDIEQEADAPNKPFINTTSLLWLPLGTTVDLEYIYVHSDGREYRISKITHARHGEETTERFVKCEVERYTE